MFTPKEFEPIKFRRFSVRSDYDHLVLLSFSFWSVKAFLERLQRSIVCTTYPHLKSRLFYSKLYTSQQSRQIIRPFGTRNHVKIPEISKKNCSLTKFPKYQEVLNRRLFLESQKGQWWFTFRILKSRNPKDQKHNWSNQGRIQKADLAKLWDRVRFGF